MVDPRDIQRLEELCIQDRAPWCEAACPLHVDARAMTVAVAQGDFFAAAAIYAKRVPFPGILSRVCDQPCRAVCKRGEAGEAIELGLLERSCADYAGFAPEAAGGQSSPSGRVAVVGGGSSGLAAALESAKRRHRVSLFEASDRLGGSLLAIPPSLLAPEVVTGEIERLAALGVDIHLNTHLGSDITLAGLLEKFDAVYLGVGRSAPASGDRRLDQQALEALAGGVDAVTFATAERAVFAGGSLRQEQSQDGGARSGSAVYSPVGSMSDGQRAAVSIDRFVEGESLRAQRENEGPFATSLFTSVAGVEPSAALSPAGPDMGYSREEAVAEAGRCLRCECLECVKACAYLEHFKEYPGKCIRKVTKNISSLPGKSYRTHTKFINACSLCGLCGTVCPTDLNMAAVNGPARQVMWEKAYMPPAIHEFAIRDMGSANMGPEALARNQPGHDSSAHVFFPGCQLAASAPSHVERTYAYLTSKLEGGVGLVLGCCGAPAAWSGRQELFEQVIGAFTRDWEEMGQPRVILACSTCALMFKERLADVPQVSLWEVLDTEGLPAVVPQGHGEVLALHDSCTAREAPEIQDSVRRIAERLGYQIEELPYSRQLTKCCGYGGLVYQSNREVTERIIRSRIEESAADYLTYCSNCRDLFAEKGKVSYHLLDLVFDGHPSGAVARPGPTLSERRANRRESAGRLLTELWGEPMPELEEHIGLKVRMAPEVAAKMEDDFILLDDVKAVIHWAETTGNKVEQRATGHIVAHLRLHIVTYWVEYAKDGDEYQVFNAYSHRMQIVKDVMP